MKTTTRLLAIAAAAAVLSAQPPARLQPGYDTILAPDLRANLTFLSSDAMEGRRSLERGSEVAVQWIASEFAKAGLKPAAGDSYLQTVPLIEYTPDRNRTSLTISAGGKRDTFHAPEISVNFPNEAAGSGDVVFAGFGISAPELNYDDYAGIDAKDKIV